MINKKNLKNNRTFFFLSLIIFLFGFQCVYAEISTEINVKESFSEKEPISFDYVISSTEDVDIIFTPYVSCPSAPSKLLAEQKISISARSEFQGTHQYLYVSGDLNPQKCTAFLNITEPIEMTEQKSFKIETLPSFEFKLLTCKHRICSNPTRIFKKGEKMHISYFSEAKNPSITMSIINPDGFSEQVILPTDIDFNQTGIYKLKAVVKKEGYKDQQEKIEIGVVEGEAIIKNEAKLVAENKGFGYFLDSILKQKFSKYNKYFVVIISSIVLLLVLLLVLLAYLIKVFLTKLLSSKDDKSGIGRSSKW